jgi:hypothetical protein
MKFKAALLLLTAAFAVGCSGMKVNHDYDGEADFASYKTFGWHDSDMNLQDTDPLSHERLVSAIEAQMRANGFQKASSNSDVVITYNVEETEEMNLNTNYMGGGWGMGPAWGMSGGAGRGRGGMGTGMGARGMAGMGMSTTTVQKYNVGTLVLDMWEVEDHRLVWRGIATETLSTNPQKNAKLIDKAAEKLFEKYPPT